MNGSRAFSNKEAQSNYPTYPNKENRYGKKKKNSAQNSSQVYPVFCQKIKSRQNP